MRPKKWWEELCPPKESSRARSHVSADNRAAKENLVGLKLFNKLVNEPLKLRLPVLTDQRLLGNHVVHQHINIGPEEMFM